MQKIKFISDMLFYIIGTVIIGIVVFIIATNFIDDKNYLNGEVVIASVATENKNKSKENEEKTNSKDKEDQEDETFNEEEFNTYIYKRAPDALRPYYEDDKEIVKKGELKFGKQVAQKSNLKDSKIDKKTKRNEDTKIEIIESKEQQGVAKKIKKALELNGFNVDINNIVFGKVSKTKIIERNNDVDGKKVVDVLKLGYILNSTSKKSEYDITIVIGNDYNPKKKCVNFLS